MLIALKDITKIYRTGEVEFPALRGITQEIAAGEFVAIMGPSGSGKTTLLNLLGCLDRPSGGEYYFAGEEISRRSEDELAYLRNQKIGFVFQNFNLLARTTALDNVQMPLLYGPRLSGRERQERARAMLKRVGLSDRMYHYPSQLSGGQQQRVAIARALINRPALLLADEPTGNLDTHSSQEIMAVFQELNAEGITIVMVTHEEDIARYARRVIHMRDGVVV